MNRFLKITMLSSLILVIAGVVFAVAGRVAGGRRQLNEMLDRQELSIPGGGRVTVGSWEGNMDFDRSRPIFEGDYSETLDKSAVESIRKLDVDVAGAGFFLYESGDDSIRIECMEMGKLQFYVEEETLYVKAQARLDWDGSMRDCVYLYVPRSMTFQEAELEMGAGEMGIDFLDTRELSCEMGAGEMYFSGLKAQDVSLEVGMGSLSVWEVRPSDVK